MMKALKMGSIGLVFGVLGAVGFPAQVALAGVIVGGPTHGSGSCTTAKAACLATCAKNLSCELSCAFTYHC